MIDYYDESGFIIDGSMKLPTFQSICDKNYFDKKQPGTYTQLSYKHKKSDLYFDTKLMLKTDINNYTNFIFKGESKSLFGNNVNQE